VSQIEIIAHRGYSAKAPENTLVALDAAVEAGADAVEFDIQTGGDGTPVLFHDDMLSRTTNGVGPVRRRTLMQMKGLDAGKWFGPDFAGEKIPSLAEAFTHLGTRVGRIYAEVKGFRELEDVDRMVRICDEAGVLDHTVFIAMNWTLLDRMRSTAPGISIGYIVEDASRVDEALQRATGDAAALIDFDARILTADPAIAAGTTEAGIDMAVWTVNDPADAQSLLDMGVRRFTTNEVEKLLAWKQTA
jgi:glycerophosphoryl diester phosphodiesterase